MNETRKALAYLASLIVLVIAVSAYATDPPPPAYTDPNLTTTNALGGVGLSVAWTKQVPITTATDLIAGTSPSIIAMRNFLRAGYAGSTLFQPGNTQVNPRFVTIKRISDDASDANLAICARLGPVTDGGGGSSPLPALSCADKNAQGDAGGCYLASTGDSCTLTMRPLRAGCTTWDTCHEPIWIVASGGTNNGSLVAVSLWQ